MDRWQEVRAAGPPQRKRLRQAGMPTRAREARFVGLVLRSVGNSSSYRPAPTHHRDPPDPADDTPGPRDEPPNIIFTGGLEHTFALGYARPLGASRRATMGLPTAELLVRDGRDAPTCRTPPTPPRQAGPPARRSTNVSHPRLPAHDKPRARGAARLLRFPHHDVRRAPEANRRVAGLSFVRAGAALRRRTLPRRHTRGTR